MLLKLRAWQPFSSGMKSLERLPNCDATETPVAPEELRRSLMGMFRSPNYHPPVLPRVALELHALSRQLDVDVKRVARLAESDPFTAAAVLRRAQSAYYSRGGASVQTIAQAITRLGTRTIGQLFLEVATTARVFRAPGFEEPMERLRTHASAVAHACAVVARHASLEDDHAFLCGLLHDVGLAASIVALCGGTARSALPDFQRVAPVLFEIHAEAGEIVTRLWRLPPNVVAVVAGHHRGGSDGFDPLCATLAVAEELAGVGGDAPASAIGWAVDGLGIGPHMDSIEHEVELLLAQQF